MEEEPKYDLVGIDGNAYSVMGYVRRAMFREKFTKKEIDNYLQDAMSDDYDHLLYVSVQMIEKCNQKAEENEY